MSADVARLCIVNARRMLRGELGDVVPCRDGVIGLRLDRLAGATRYLDQALAALRPPAEPPSVMFWLGADTMSCHAIVPSGARTGGRQSLPGVQDVREDPSAPEPPHNALRAVSTGGGR